MWKKFRDFYIEEENKQPTGWTIEYFKDEGLAVARKFQIFIDVLNDIDSAKKFIERHKNIENTINKKYNKEYSITISDKDKVK